MWCFQLNARKQIFIELPHWVTARKTEKLQEMAKNGESDQYKGWLYKWTNYIKGYQKRYFVIHNGYLSYYRFGIEISCPSSLI